LTTATFLLVACAAIILGVALIALSGAHTLWTGKGVWEVIFAQLGTALIVAVGLALVWELAGRRAFKREILETARTVADIEAAGVVRVGTKIWEEVEWDRLFRTARELDIYFAYGRTWRGLNLARLRQLAAKPDARIRIYLPDPRDTACIEQLAVRFNMPEGDLLAAIDEAHREFARLAGQNGRVSVYFRPGQPVFSVYRFDATIIAALYTHRQDRQDVPAIVCSVGGTLYEFFRKELEAIEKQSRPATSP